MEKIKKTWRFVLLVIAALCLSSVFVACSTNGNGDGSGNGDGDNEGGGKAEHSHVYVDTVVDPDCTEQGYTLHKCSCGDEYKDTYVNALGHDEQTHEAKEPTCVEIGWNAYVVCSRCDYTTYSEINATGHAYTAYVYNNDASCGVDGTETAKCDNCDVHNTRKSQSHLKTGLHAFTTYTYNNDATCVADGTETAKCENCDEYDLRISQSHLKTGAHTYEDYVCSMCYCIAPNAPETQGLTYSPIEQNGVTLGYSVTKGSATIGKYVKIPSMHDFLPVLSIGNNAFYNCSNLTSIAIPNSIVSIGEYAFCNCRSLRSIEIPNSVTSIGDNVFYDCFSLTSIVIPSSVTSMGEYVFLGCSSLTVYCENTSAPDGWDSHWNSYYLIVWDSKNNDKDEKGYAYTVIDGVRYSIKDGVATVCRQPRNLSGNKMIRSSITYKNVTYSVTSIASMAFGGCTALTSIIIPSSVTNISDWVFNDCSSLTSVVIPNSVTRIKNYTFYNCSGLTSIVIPDSVTSIESDVFYGCGSLTSVTIGSGVKSIGSRSFGKCGSLTSINYNGTMAQWNAIKVSLNDTSIKTVICTDGTITI